MRFNKNGTDGFKFIDGLAIAFIVLKLCGIIDWSWKWVLAPIWIPLVIVIIGILGTIK